MPKHRLLTIISIGLIIAGAVIAYLGLEREVLLMVDGQPQTVRTRAVTLGGILRAAGYTTGPNDRISPTASTWMLGRSTARLDRAQSFQLVKATDNEIQTLALAERIPANLLAAAGILLFPGDRLIYDGAAIDPYTALPAGKPTTINLEFQPAVPITVADGKSQRTVYSSASTVYEALWQSGIKVSLADRLSPSGNTQLSGPMTIEIERAQPVTIQLAGSAIQTATTAGSVGEC
ncbi:DUF348 domain-containing protein [bacterium]|nr:DUF348 domain-containing protein [bacterium]